MKLIFIGCVEFSFRTLKCLYKLDHVQLVGIITRRASRINADFFSLESLADELSIPYYLADDKTQNEMVEWIKTLEPDVIYCFGWSYLLGNEILQLPRLGVIGYHPAALPQNRGRHPIIWALALGLKETASTFFIMDQGADSGKILSQEYVPIGQEDDASTLYHKLETTALGQISNFTEQLATNQFVTVSQDHAKANYWRRRTKKDGEIDWRMPAVGIYNLVRALTYPYVGAHCIFNGAEIKIWKAEIVDLHCPNMEPGKVLKIEGTNITVKSGAGAIKLVKHEFKALPEEGTYL